MTEQIPRVLLIDLENCPSQINQLKIHLEKYSLVVVCYAQSGAKIPIDWLMPLTAIGNNKRLKWVKMPEVGKNAADFGITFWAGVLMSKLPAHTHFDIVSNDTDLDYVVSLLQDQKRSAERIGTKKRNLPVSTTKPIETKATTEIKVTKIEATNLKMQNHFHEYCSHLVNTHKTNKPVKKDTLLNSIKSKFNSTVTVIDANQLVETLVKNGVIAINADKVIYNQQKLNQFANK
jgi:hypothetical protein